MKLEPPGLPPRLVDESEDTFMTVESSWDALAKTAIKIESIQAIGGFDRVRVKWLRWSVIRWCCWRPMRLGCFEYQPKKRTFGWAREVGKFVACQCCGRIKSTLSW